MILVDTSVWIDHLRARETALVAALGAGRVLGHSLVTAEIALGSLGSRAEILALLDGLAQAPTAQVREVRHLNESRHLFGRGIGYGDASLVAACLLVPGTTLWTRDRGLSAVVRDLGIAHPDADPL